MNAGWITLIIIAIIVFLLITLKLYVKLSAGRDRSPTCLVGKTAIVTGANTGIGFYTAQDFAKRGARVILACRDPLKAEEARIKIIEATGNLNVVARIVDFASLASVRRFVVEIKATEERLDILVNNAGLAGMKPSVTADGLNFIMQVNHFGPFLLTVLLLGLLKRSAPSRIVNVSSFVAYFAKLNPYDLNAPSTRMFAVGDYANSKICNVLFANELALKLKGYGVDVNSLHPGAIYTDFARDLSNIYKRIYETMKIFYKTSEEGAQTSIYLAVSKDIEGVSGEYFIDCKKARMPKAGRDEELAKKVWEKSMEFVKLTAEERKML